MKRSWGISLVILVSIVATVSGQLSGTYTIDPGKPASKTNYQSFGAATTALAAGINGHVVFKVASTTFREAVRIGPVSGASPAATITFEAEGAPAVIAPSYLDQRYGIYANKKTAWYRFTNFRITGYLYCGIWLSGDQNGETTDCIFTRCLVDDGSTYWRTIYGLYAERAVRLVLRDCVFRSNYQPLRSTQRESTYERCEFDGKGLADRLAVFNTYSSSSSELGLCVFQNNFFHDCRPEAYAAVSYSGYGRNDLFVNNTIIAKLNRSAVQVSGGGEWSRATVFRNNIVMNLGSGPAIEYRIRTEPFQFDSFVSDHNAFYAPNARHPIVVGSTSSPYFAGNLAQFQAWQKANPKAFRPGGATSIDANSIEGNPGFEKSSPPWDVHLAPTSPLIGRGSSKLIPSYVSTRAWTNSHDFDGGRRFDPMDIGADEVDASIDGTGTGRIGTAMQLGLFVRGDEGLPYQVATSLGKGPIQIGSRQLELTFDALAFVCFHGLLPDVFQDYVGRLDASGRGTASLAIPRNIWYVGVDLHTAFVTLDPAAPQGIRSISKPYTFRIR